MKKNKKITLPKLFSKKYSGKTIKKRILDKLYIPADKKLVESLIVTGKNKKGRTVYTFDPKKAAPPATMKKLKVIAKDIRKQKGRFKIVHIVISLACVLILLAGIALFRNVLARKLVTGAMENTFGAVCDIGIIDFDIFATRFVIEDLEQANRSKPMTNLFAVGRFELYFNLLELTRGKLVSETVEITGVRIGTDRTVTGALSPRKERKYLKKKEAQEKNPGPVRKAITEKIDTITSGISVDSGLAAVKNQLDPAAILEREKDKLKAPAVLEELSATVPDITATWQKNSARAESQLTSTQEATQKIAAINVDEIKTVEDGNRVLKTIEKSGKTIDESLSMTRTYTEQLEADRKKVMELSKRAQDAIAADAQHLSSLAKSVSSFNLDRGKGLIAQVIEQFAMSALGDYYPWLDRGLTMLQRSQSGKKAEKNQTHGAKTSAFERLTGRTFIFGSDSLPGVVFKNISLSAADDARQFSAEGQMQNLSNNADQLDKPALVTLGTVHGTMRESVQATIDLRSDAKTVLDSDVTVQGYAVSLDSAGTQGVPSISGTLSANGQIRVMEDRALSIDSEMRIGSATITVEPFEPRFIFSAYRKVLSGMRTLDFSVKIDIASDGELSLSISTDADKLVYRAIQGEIDRQFGELAKQLDGEIAAYINNQKKQHARELDAFTAVQDRLKQVEKEMRAQEDTVERKKEAIEKRMKSLVEKKTAPVLQDAEKSLKKLF